jgi:hypothetical protein
MFVVKNDLMSVPNGSKSIKDTMKLNKKKKCLNHSYSLYCYMTSGAILWGQRKPHLDQLFVGGSLGLPVVFVGGLVLNSVFVMMDFGVMKTDLIIYLCSLR